MLPKTFARNWGKTPLNLADFMANSAAWMAAAARKRMLAQAGATQNVRHLGLTFCLERDVKNARTAFSHSTKMLKVLAKPALRAMPSPLVRRL